MLWSWRSWNTEIVNGLTSRLLFKCQKSHKILCLIIKVYGFIKNYLIFVVVKYAALLQQLQYET